MNQEQRNKLRNAVQEMRRVLEADLGQQLSATYGVLPDGTVYGLEKLPNLRGDTERLDKRQIILSAIRDYAARRVANSPKAPREIQPEDREDYLRAHAFTLLNRFAGLRLLEARGFLLNVLKGGKDAQGFKFFTMLAKPVLPPGEDGYGLYLDLQLAEIAAAVPALRDRSGKFDVLRPTEAAALSLIEEMDGLEDSIWQQDETLGWMYQYFTPEEKRREARKASSAPRNSDELAFRNQFFTPEYVVRFLTQNTLGRLWFEMTAGRTRLAQGWDYLVRSPSEVFVSAAAPKPYDLKAAWSEQPFTPDDLSRLVEFAHLRPPFNWGDDPRMAAWERDLEGLNAGDPEDPVAGESADLWDWLFAVVRANRFNDGALDANAVAVTRIANELRRRLPELELLPPRKLKDPREFRVIDPACGSGHFLLYSFEVLHDIYHEAYERSEWGEGLRADHPDPEEFARRVPELVVEHNLYGVDIDARVVQVTQVALYLKAKRLHKDTEPRRGNIVHAQQLPGVKEQFDTFAEELFKASGRRHSLVSAFKIVYDDYLHADELGILLKTDERVEAIAKHDPLFNRTGLLYEVKQGLDAYVAEAADEANLAELMFGDASRQAVELLGLMALKYDVVLMNPPFGAAALDSKKTFEKLYPKTKNDLYAAFVERGLDLLYPGGRLGAITSRTGFFLKTFTKWREDILLGMGHLDVVADLGYGVLDKAMVETAAYVVEKR